MAVKLHTSFAVRPGPWRRAEIGEPYGLSVTDAAAKLHVTWQAMSNLLGGRAGLSAEMALRFEKAFALSADTLMRMQAAHDLAQVRVRAGTIEVERWRPNLQLVADEALPAVAVFHDRSAQLGPNVLAACVGLHTIRERVAQ